MAIDPIDAALDAAVAYFASAVPTLADVVKGFPEHNDAIDLGAGAVLSVAQIGTPEAAYCSPGIVDTIDGQPLTHQYRVAWFTMFFQLDLWAPYKAQREIEGVLVDAALNNNLPYTSGLRLLSTGYYGRPLDIRPINGRLQDEGNDDAVRGEWRRTWDLEVRSDLIVDGVTTPRQDTITQVLTTALGTQDVIEPEYDITP